MSVPERRAMVERPGENLSVRRQCALLNLARSGVYRSGPATSTDDLALMRRIDELHLAWRSSTSVSPSATRKATARGHGNAPAIVRRGDPVRFQLLGFCVYPRAEADGRRHGPQNARRWSSAADLPDMSKCF
jgi:hypothetical protein